MGRLRILLAAATVLVGSVGVAVLVTPADAAGSLTATLSYDSDWGSGYQAKYTIANGTSSTVTSWTVTFDLASGAALGSYWDALMSQSGTHVTATNRNYNGTIAPGGSTTFGFIVTGSAKPTGCKINGAACGGGGGGTTPTPTTSPTTSPTASPPPPPPPPPPGSVFVAPYVDMGAWPTPSLTDMAGAGNLKNFTLAFITASGCKAMWFNAYDPRAAWSRDQIDAIRSRGGDVKISFGGASGIELAQACSTAAATEAEYQAVVDAYNLKYIDLDIEGAAVADPTTIARRSQALKLLQTARPNVRVSLTLPVLPEGLTADGLNVVRSARDAGVSLDLVNIMAMDYQRSSGDYGNFAVQAAQSTFSQLKGLYPSRTDAQVWRMLGVTPMLGKNDDGGTYDQNDARQLVTFAKANHLGMLAFWEMTRDRNACNGALYMCTNIPQQPYEFSKIFAGYTG
jgi:Cellulose binding domain/Glycosyl hydrolases family 18